VVIAIVGILAAVGAPSFSTFLNNSRLNSTSSQLLNELNLARSEAVKRNARVLVCVRNAAGTDCGTSTNWAAGWLVCYDNETASTPAARRRSNPWPETSGLGSAMAATTFWMPAAINASQQGPVRPWWAHGSSET